MKELRVVEKNTETMNEFYYSVLLDLIENYKATPELNVNIIGLTSKFRNAFKGTEHLSGSSLEKFDRLFSTVVKKEMNVINMSAQCFDTPIVIYQKEKQRLILEAKACVGEGDVAELDLKINQLTEEINELEMLTKEKENEAFVCEVKETECRIQKKPINERTENELLIMRLINDCNGNYLNIKSDYYSLLFSIQFDNVEHSE